MARSPHEIGTGTVTVDGTMKGPTETVTCVGAETEAAVESDGAPGIGTSTGTAVGPRSRGLPHSLMMGTRHPVLRRRRSRMHLLPFHVSFVRIWEGDVHITVLI